ncbi:unnamed protein product [Adineta ricciae]|uniref:Uncharacterized protein n=1 Tax=Adineta ricciae TaxID=249248 RepID=A0A815J7A0_ADIRI|nr:unnamed protein product [Adineta ricciae]CAF1469361.1 unnamed protein product [Adineta ricciae]
MLIEVHYGNGSVLLINGNCRSINFVNYLRKHCCVSLTIPIDLCSLNTGEPFHLLSSQSKIVSADQRRLPAHSHCVLTRIEEDGTYIPLLNDPTLITNEFLAKLKRATSTSVKSIPTKTKPTKQQKLQIEKVKRRRSLKSVAIVATIVNNLKH